MILGRRETDVLTAVVETYVETAQPVASQALAAGLGLSSASLRSTMAEYSATTLTTFRPGLRGGLHIIDLEPGAARQADPHQTGTQEHVVVCTGRVRLGPLDHPVTLGPGDYAMFPGDVAHSYEALRKGTRLVLVMDHL